MGKLGNKRVADPTTSCCTSPLLHAEEAARLAAAAAADAAAPRREFLWAPPPSLAKLLARLLADPRDAPILWLYLNIAACSLPAVAALFACFPASRRPLPHWLGATYLAANYVAFLARFMLSLHYSEHRRLFRRGMGVWAVHGRAAGDGRSGSCCEPSRPQAAAAISCLSLPPQGWSRSTTWRRCCWRRCLACPRVRCDCSLRGLACHLAPPLPGLPDPAHTPLLCPARPPSFKLNPPCTALYCSVPPGMYSLHHVVMHHIGGNRAAAGDASSTERYQRDSLPAFLHYWLRFALAGWLEVGCPGRPVCRLVD